MIVSDYAWVVDKDYISDETPVDDWGKLSAAVAVDVCGPSDATDAQIERARSEGKAFRMYDDDGILYYSGRCWTAEPDSEELFGPLDDYGMPNAGAVVIKYREGNRWVTL